MRLKAGYHTKWLLSQAHGNSTGALACKPRAGERSERKIKKLDFTFSSGAAGQCHQSHISAVLFCF